MGREIRMVPPNWEHPRRDCPHESGRGGCSEARRNGGKCYLPMRDKDAESAFREWQENYAAWLAGEHDRIIAQYGADDYPKNEPYRSFCLWHGQPPDPEHYRPVWTDEEATWVQVYQTVSEGSPVTPPFATRAELVDYLVAHGDFWDQARRAEGSGMECGPWERANAEAFVNAGWAPSMIVTTGPSGVSIQEPRDTTAEDPADDR